MKINLLSKTNTSEIFSLLKQNWRLDIPKQKNLKSFQIEDDKFLVMGDNIIIVKIGQNVLLPFLTQSELLNSFPSVFVDMGAIKFVCNGAKVTRPGITKNDFFNKQGIVIVRDESYSKALAVGLAMVNSQDLDSISKGHVVDTLHYISDKFWNTYKEIHN